jgi:DNA-binding response OmpR family regulator
MRILVVEDHPTLGQDLKKGLENCRYAVDLVGNEEDALAQVGEKVYNLIILDIFLPGSRGWDFCQQLRKRQEQHEQQPIVSILFLTALNRMDRRVEGLDLGADDYLVKPFAFCELEARVQVLLQRDGASPSSILRFLDITLDTRTQEVRRGQRVVSLSSKEYALLNLLMRSPQHVLSRTTIAEHVWDYDADHLSNVIDVYVRYLRSKLCAEGEPDVIQTVPNAGYQLGYQLKEAIP